MGTTRKLAIKAYHDAHPQPKKETKPAEQSAGGFLGKSVAYVAGALGFSGASAQTIAECNKPQWSGSIVKCGDDGNEEEGYPTRMYYTKVQRVNNQEQYPTCAQIACDNNDSALDGPAVLGKFRSTLQPGSTFFIDIKNDGRCCVGENVNGDPMTTQPIWRGMAGPVRDDNRTQIAGTDKGDIRLLSPDGCLVQGRLRLPAFTAGDEIKLLEADPIECFAGNENVTIAKQIWDDNNITYANFRPLPPKPTTTVRPRATPTPTPINRTSPGFATTVMAGVSTAAVSVAQTVSAFVSPTPTRAIYDNAQPLDITPIAIAAGVAGAAIVVVGAGIAGVKLVHYFSPAKVIPITPVAPPVELVVINNPAYEVFEPLEDIRV